MKIKGQILPCLLHCGRAWLSGTTAILLQKIGAGFSDSAEESTPFIYSALEGFPKSRMQRVSKGQGQWIHDYVSLDILPCGIRVHKPQGLVKPLDCNSSYRDSST